MSDTALTAAVSHGASAKVPAARSRERNVVAPWDRSQTRAGRNVVGSGFLVLAAIVLVWPLVAWLVAALGRAPAADRWRPFAWAAGVAGAVALVALLAAYVRFQANGTTEAMVALGGQIFAGACLAGALVSGVCAVVLRATADR
jgi:hypothetical protein